MGQCSSTTSATIPATTIIATKTKEAHPDVATNVTSNLPKSKHVMLSYQWASQELVKNVYTFLLSKNLAIWMDINGGMTANIYQW
jgi:hypothetical protein